MARSGLPVSLLILAGGLAALSIGCELERICAPGATQSCHCSGSATGVQVCDERGQAWGACGGCAAIDAGVDQPPLVFIDGPPPDRPPADSCQPQCTGRECGPDGCGGSCAPGCANGALCEQGACTPAHLSFNTATLPPPPFGPTPLPNFLYETGMKGPKGDPHTVSCVASNGSLRVKASDGATSFEIEGKGWSPTTCSLNHVADFTAALLKPSLMESWGFLPPHRPNGEGKYLLNFYLDCQVAGSVLSGTFFFQVLYRGNQDLAFVTLDKGKLRCELK